MQIRNIVIGGLTAVVAAVSLAGAANADTSVYNRYENRHIYNGSSETNVQSTINSVSKTKTISESTKVEAIADLGDVNVANVSYRNGEFSANAHSSNLRPVDPQAAIYVTNVKQIDFNTTRELTNVNQTTKYNFSGTDREHRNQVFA